ncbi:tripartite tricarboxylate transporter substrate binding protein [Halomonas sp. ML-15]|uniref:tripartite tricarboxylate transporter substrate binding protein n=1 Tax=Halomonas sp. ML-15 TaxID=2773305 RepID=UPI0017461A3A|nr:tripartite tricarboxylate transporter substrate binding protein [Halomonas sp. ML-15]MBD3897538.1 tripartite tricarboxylate transporter substrate binding protein [Halomonas sp. ML-15]
MTKKMKLATLFGAPFLLAASGAALAQDYPTGNIQIIVPYSAGGGGDTVARIIADRLSDELGQQVNVVNREGAGGEIGIAEMAGSDPDGYTLGVFGYPDNFVLENTRDTSFDNDSFEYLASFDDMPMGIFSGPGSELDSLEAMRSYGEENPGALVIGESGAIGLLNILALSDDLGIETTPVLYSGGGELMNALLGNHIDLASTSSMSHDPITDAGGTPIGFAAAERMDMFPDVPTFKEQGIDLEMGVSRVMVAPTGLPDEVRDILTSALDEISTNEAMIENFQNASLPYRYLNAEETEEMVERSNNVLSPIIEENLEQFNID